jgi:hypothetical protein
MEKMIPIALERKLTNHICLEMEISEPRRDIIVFEKDIYGYKGYSDKTVRFEVTDREIAGKRIFRETN